jgi:outer membrane immunogenic protein
LTISHNSCDKFATWRDLNARNYVTLIYAKDKFRYRGLGLRPSQFISTIRIYNMKKMTILAAATTALLTSPAMAAGEGYVKARVSYDSTEVEAETSGVSESDSTGKGIGYGIAAGYDFDLGSSAFVGGEIGFDDSTADRTDDGFTISSGREISAVARLGFKSNAFKVYGLGGYSNVRIKISDGVNSDSASDGGFTYGAGASYDVTEKLALSVEYRKISVDGGQDVKDFLGVDDVNFNKSRVLVGLAYKF